MAVATGVSFEWLATGRGQMLIDRAVMLDTIAATTGRLVDDALELRLIEAFRRAPVRARMPVMEVVEGWGELRLKPLGVYGILCKRSFVNSVTSALQIGS